MKQRADPVKDRACLHPLCLSWRNQARHHPVTVRQRGRLDVDAAGRIGYRLAVRMPHTAAPFWTTPGEPSCTFIGPCLLTLPQRAKH